MPIVLSKVLRDDAQHDGRRWVTEAHTDHLGVVHFDGPRLLAAGEKPDLTGHAAMIEGWLDAPPSDPSPDPVALLAEARGLLDKHAAALKDPGIDEFLAKVAA